MKIILAGGSGFLGRHLASFFYQKGDEAVVLTRSPILKGDRVREVLWDGRTMGDWITEIEDADVVINLTGKNVSCLHTEENRKEINASRTDSIGVLARAIEISPERPRLWIQAAGIAIYGDVGESNCDEETPPGKGLLVGTCLLWENAFDIVDLPGLRKMLLRVGVVLGREGGALAELEKITRQFMGGSVGSGKQTISWIHVKDVLLICDWLIGHPEAEGILNVCSPHPVSNREFMRELRRVMKRPWSPPIPPFAVRVGAWLMGSEAELVLSGRSIEPRNLLTLGYRFAYPGLPEALDDLFYKQTTKEKVSL